MTLEQKIQTALDKGLIEGAKRNLRLLFEQEHKAEWDKEKRAEYDALYHEYREATTEERENEYNLYVSNCNSMNMPVEYTIDNYEIDLVPIDYSEDENYVTFQEWLNETRVVTEAVEAVTEIDAEGFEVIVTPYIPEVTELVRPYVAPDTTDRVNAYMQPVEEGIKISEAKKYLDDTDWYYARKLEEGTEIPADVIAKRIELRALINSLEG